MKAHFLRKQHICFSWQLLQNFLSEIHITWDVENGYAFHSWYFIVRSHCVHYITIYITKINDGIELSSLEILLWMNCTSRFIIFIRNRTNSSAPIRMQHLRNTRLFNPSLYLIRFHCHLTIQNLFLLTLNKSFFFSLCGFYVVPETVVCLNARSKLVIYWLGTLLIGGLFLFSLQ